MNSTNRLRAVDSIDLAIRSGEIYGFLGPNGAGKSTALNLLSGFLRPDSGSISIMGVDALAHPRDVKSLLGLVPQELALYGELTCRQNLGFFGRLYGLGGATLAARTEQLLAMVELTERAGAEVRTLSGGMQRRLNIAAALIHSPPVLLMDEPTVGLDPQNRQKILDLVKQLAGLGTTVIYTSHYMEEVEAVCDRIGIIDHGKLLVEGTLAELQAEAGGADCLTATGSFDLAKIPASLGSEPGETLVKLSHGEVVLELADAARQLSSTLAGLSQAGEVREVTVTRPSLESLFIKLTGRELRE